MNWNFTIRLNTLPNINSIRKSELKTYFDFLNSSIIWRDKSISFETSVIRNVFCMQVLWMRDEFQVRTHDVSPCVEKLEPRPKFWVEGSSSPIVWRLHSVAKMDGTDTIYLSRWDFLGQIYHMGYENDAG